MALELARVRALCFDVDGSIADTDDHADLILRTISDLLAVPDPAQDPLGKTAGP